ncbi:endonuclease NucS domain-containing protein [Streptomyces virginiae]|uniref:endonuclease NucS domain-containing protein n=1 Tax=Streptomyces virginiae TaxID=1961 RepID=UPI0035DD7666
MSGLKLFSTLGGVREIAPRLAEEEADIQALIETHMEVMLGVRFLASEYEFPGGRIDSLGLDENDAPVVVEYKRGTHAGVINQGLYYLAWVMDHRDFFRQLVEERLGSEPASRLLWSGTRLICVAGDYTRYDIHALREYRRSIDLVRYRYFGAQHVALETVASAAGPASPRRSGSRRAVSVGQRRTAAMAELQAAVDEVLLGLGDGVIKVENKTYTAYQRLRNFACVCPPQREKVLVYLKTDPSSVDLVPGLTRDVTGIGHHGTGDLELQLRSERDLPRAAEYFRHSYAAA